jgi:hypothetical protein
MNTNFIDELSFRVYDNLGEKFLREYQLFGTQLPDENELANYIGLAIDMYVSPDEKKQYLIDNLGEFDDEDVNSLMIRIAVRMAALDVHMKIRNALTTKNLSDKDIFDWAI